MIFVECRGPPVHSKETAGLRANGVQMIGFLAATEGDAIINGRNIKTDMNDIYTFMVRPIAHTPTNKYSSFAHPCTGI
jgi:hypothetical protein